MMSMDRLGAMKESARLKKVMRPKVIIPVVAGTAVVGMLCFGHGTVSASPISSDTAEVRSLVNYSVFTGNIEACNDVTVAPKVSAAVREVYHQEGDEVKAGDVLAQLDDTQLRESIRLKEKALSESQLQNYYAIQDARRAYEEYRESIENGVNSTLISAKSSLDGTKRAYEEAKESYERAKLELDNNMDSSMVSANNQVEQARLDLEKAKKEYDDNEGNIRGAGKGVDNAEGARDANPTSENEASLSAAKTRLDDLEGRRQSLQEAIDSAQRSYDMAVQGLKGSYYAANVNLSKLKEEMDARQEDCCVAEENYNSVLASVSQTLENYEITAEKTQALSNDDLAAMELDSLNRQLEDYKVTAPIDGTLTSFKLKAGDSFSADRDSVEITDYSRVQVGIKIDEYSILGVREGSAVKIHVDSVNRDYDGILKNVSRKATEDKGVSYFTATVEFDADECIRSGMSAEVKLESQCASDVVTVPVGAVGYDADGSAYVNVLEDGKQERKNVTIGMSDGSYVEVQDGLAAGDVVQMK